MTRTLRQGMGIPESARWRDGRLWLADWGAGEILALDPAGGGAEVVLRLDALPLCFDWLPDGRLLVVDGTARRLLRQEPGGSLTELADLRAIGDFPWNEIAVDAAGNAFVNCVGFDFPGGAFAPGFVAVVPPGGEARRVAGDLMFPNGMVVAGGELVVAESHASRLTAFPIGAGGELGERRVLAAVPGSAPDGICLDGHFIWYADVPNRRCVRLSPEGEVDRVVEAEDGCFSCAVGGPDLFLLTAGWGPRGAAAGSGRVVAVTR